MWSTTHYLISCNTFDMLYLLHTILVPSIILCKNRDFIVYINRVHTRNEPNETGEGEYNIRLGETTETTRQNGKLQCTRQTLRAVASAVSSRGKKIAGNYFLKLGKIYARRSIVGGDTSIESYNLLDTFNNDHVHEENENLV